MRRRTCLLVRHARRGDGARHGGGFRPAQTTPSVVPVTLTIGQIGDPGSLDPARRMPHRDGLAHAALRAAPLHTSIGTSRSGAGQIEQPALVTSDAIIVVTTHGDVVCGSRIDAREGRTRARAPKRSASPRARAPRLRSLLSGGTVVVVSGGSDAMAVGVNKNGVVFRTQLVGGVVAQPNSLDIVAPLRPR